MQEAENVGDTWIPECGKEKITGLSELGCPSMGGLRASLWSTRRSLKPAGAHRCARPRTGLRCAPRGPARHARSAAGAPRAGSGPKE